MIEFKTLNGRILYVNPDHIVSVEHIPAYRYYVGYGTYSSRPNSSRINLIGGFSHQVEGFFECD